MEMAKEDNEILKHNHGEKSMRISFITYADTESLLEKMSTCHNNLKKSSTTKINKYLVSVCSLSTHCWNDTTKNRLDCYRGKDCMKNFSKELKEHATKQSIMKKEKWYH